MKKTIFAAVLALTAVAATAQTTAFATYDYDRANKGQGWKSQHEAAVGVQLPTSIGTFEAAVLGRQLVTRVRDDNAGFELGYTNGIKLGAVNVDGRITYGRLNQVDLRNHAFKGNSSFVSYGVEASTALTPTVGAFAGFRLRDGINGDTPEQQRYTVGLDVRVSKELAVRAGVAHSREAGVVYNGLTTAVSYSF